MATDDGLGAKRTRLSHATRAGGTATDYRTHPCAGNRFDYCPAPYNRDGVGFNQTFQVNTDDLPEGTVDLNATTTDVTDNDSTRNVPVKIDRTPPELSVSGGLRRLIFDESGRDLFDLRVEARDGAQGGSPSEQRVGVRDVTVTIGGTVQASAASDANCVQSCAVTIDDFVSGLSTSLPLGL